ncbi:tryptophan-rich sensory protein [Clostridium sp. 'deep sea']|uniref:TspO/MBR family protein n=1 Tax=Clostridium sp. 'deep sea' TaxID=2779445 RepID=UPI00189698E3|nr:TspO/MBR family protein [Clostridium sp. 'deep sea']QOR36537.1 tryptophan-rich sensory protein [Clostridium sp. 'deep sea']
MKKKFTKNDIFLLAISLLITLLVGYIGSIFTATSINDWYMSLNKPSFTPPSSVFAPVWTFIYILMGISLFLVWRQNTDIYYVRQALKLFFLQLFLNLAWSFAFFYLQSPFLALLIILLLLISIWYTIKAFKTVSKPAAYLLYPYLIWVSFAAILNAAIWWLNR